MSRFTSFSEEIMGLVTEHFTNAKVEITDIQKNNGIILKALIIQEENTNIAPTIYLESFYEMYENGKDIEIIFNMILDTYQTYKVDSNFNVDHLSDFDNVRARVIYSVINTEKNSELLNDIPHRDFLDLSIVYYIFFITDGNTLARSLIHNSHCNTWGITEEELYIVSQINTPVLLKPDFKSISSFLNEIGCQLKQHEGEPYILTTEYKSFGACYMANNKFIKTISENLESDLIILPSSINELIILEDENIFHEDIAHVVYEVNRDHVNESEFLSNNIYLYSKEQDKLFIYERS